MLKGTTRLCTLRLKYLTNCFAYTTSNSQTWEGAKSMCTLTHKLYDLLQMERKTVVLRDFLHDTCQMDIKLTICAVVYYQSL